MDTYQFGALETAIYPGQGGSAGLTYAVLGLTNEAGEVAGKLKKIMRDKGWELDYEDRQEMVDELGDVLWYLTAVADELQHDLAEVAEQNLAKLADRAQRGVLGGSGDNR